MISRMWSGRTTTENAEKYLAHLKDKVFPELRRIDGHRGASVLRRDLDEQVEFVVLTYWESMEAIRQFAGPDAEVAVVEPAARAMLSDFDSTVRHHEVAFGSDQLAGETADQETGTITWTDLTVDNAEEMGTFYRQVVGWKTEPVEMKGYRDFAMATPRSGRAIAGVCHARGANAGLPPQWLIYITVDDVDASAARCVELGGTLIAEPRSMGSDGRYCVIQDPAGAVAALFAPDRK